MYIMRLKRRMGISISTEHFQDERLTIIGWYIVLKELRSSFSLKPILKKVPLVHF